MNKAKSYAHTYLGIGLGFIGFSFLPKVLNPTSLVALGGAFLLVALMFFLSMKFRWRWLIKSLAFIKSISVTHIALFLTLIGFALGLILAKFVLLGVLVILAAYIMFGLSIGQQLGRGVLRPLFDKLNIFIPSTKLPKDI